MVGLMFFLLVVLVLSIVAIAIWLWAFIDILDQVAALIRIKVTEQVAVWRIESIGRISRMEQQRLRDE